MRGKRGTIVALLVAAVAFSVVFAMAATLGGVTSSTVGADNVVVAACDTDGVTTSYATAWDATDKRYEITSVTVSGVADTCDNQNLSVSMTDTSGAQLGTGTMLIPTSAATLHTVTLTTAASAKDSLGVHVLIAS